MFRKLRKKLLGKRKRKIYLFLTIFASMLIAGSAVVLFVFAITEVPSIENFEKREVSESTRIYDRTGEILLWEIHGEERRTVMPFDKISRHVKNATVAIEDDSFYSHPGFRPLSIVRALFVDLFQNKRQGGSTITQQLVKNTLLTPEQTLQRKLKEIIVAVKLETVYTKDEILNLYLNEIPYGTNAYGIEAASQTYFSKSSQDLTLTQAAYLAALPKAPSYYSPYGNHRDELEARKGLVLARMKDLGFLTNEEYESAKKEHVSFAPQKRLGLRAPHFVMYVREILNEEFGEDVVERGGLRVITTLDTKLQEKAEEIVGRRSKELEKNFNATNMGLVAIDPKTGRILAMVGSRDYFDTANEGNFNVTLAKRQPGSAFKPIVYATAFKKEFTPDTVIFDLETNFAAAGEPYVPQNFDEKFRGPVTMRQALAQSLNVPSVKTLYLAGLKDSIKTAQSMGISTLTDPQRYGLTLVLGGGEVTLLELSGAYGAFANQGTKADTHAIIEVRDRNDKVIKEENITSRRVLDEGIVNNINSILSDNEARAPSFGVNSPLAFEQGGVAVKTGTTNDYRDVWTIGYSPNIVVGAWAGNNNNASIAKNVAGFIIAPVWREYTDYALTLYPRYSFSSPPANNAAKPVLRGIWKGSRVIGEGDGRPVIPQEIHSILYWVDKDNPDGPVPGNPGSDPQFYNWEGPVLAWASSQGIKNDDASSIKDEFDSVHAPERWPKVEFENAGAAFKLDELVIIRFRISGTYPVKEVNIFIDGEFVKSTNRALSSITFRNVEPGNHRLTLRVYDDVGNRQEAESNFTVEGL